MNIQHTRVETNPNLIQHSSQYLRKTPLENLITRKSLPRLRSKNVSVSTSWISENKENLKLTTKIKRYDEIQNEGEFKNIKNVKNDKTRTNLHNYRTPAGSRWRAGMIKIGGTTEGDYSMETTPSTSRETLGNGVGEERSEERLGDPRQVPDRVS